MRYMESQKKNKKSSKKVSNKTSLRRFDEWCFKLESYVITLGLSIFIAPLIFFLSFYVHEGGHMIYAILDNLLIYRRFPEIIISNWVDAPIFSFSKLPQQTMILNGRFSLNFALGGIIFTLFVSIFLSYIFYKYSKNENKKWIFSFPVLFLLHDIAGNYICGTDNPTSLPLILCGHSQIFHNTTIAIPFLMMIPTTIILLPYIQHGLKKLVNSL